MLSVLQQVYDVEGILTQIRRGKHCGETLSAKMKSGVECTTEERRFLVKVLGKFLMRNAKV